MFPLSTKVKKPMENHGRMEITNTNGDNCIN